MFEHIFNLLVTCIGALTSPWTQAAGFGLFLFGFTWTQKVNGVGNLIDCSYINLLQTEKIERDGQVPMTGVFQPDMGATVTPVAGVLTLGNDGNYFAVEAGNFASIVQTAFGGAAVQPGTVANLHFNGVSVITHSADIVLPGGANITSVAGDEAEFICYAVGDWRCAKYQRLTGWQDTRTTSGPTFNHAHLSGAAMQVESSGTVGALNYATDAGREAVGGQALEAIVKSENSATYHRMILDNRQDCVLLMETITY